MKTAYVILAFPVFIFLALSVTLDFGSMYSIYPEQDYTLYLTARSLGLDGDIAHTREDSDRFFKELNHRPVPILLVQKKILDASGEYRSYLAYYAPDVLAVVLMPFVCVFGFRGILIFHTLLMAALYWAGYSFYRSGSMDHTSTAFRTLATFILIPLPILFLIPTHHLFLFVLCASALSFAFRGYPVLSAILLAAAASTQPWALVLAVPLVSGWQFYRDSDSEKSSGAIHHIWRFILTLIVALFLVWAFERLLYPPDLTSEARWMKTYVDIPLATVWDSLPVRKVSLISRPEMQRVMDFFFGRNTGFFLYGFAACSLILSSLWWVGDKQVRLGILFVILFLVVVSVADPTVWNFATFVNDFWVMLCAYACFHIAHAFHRRQLAIIAFLSLIFVGPLLSNPLGAVTGYASYVHEYPFALFPAEASLAGQVGNMRTPDYQFTETTTRIYFLNDHFYKEDDFFWVQGESTLEFLMESKPDTRAQLLIRNGSVDNRVEVRMGGKSESLTLPPAASAQIEIGSGQSIRQIGNRQYIHGTIQSRSGYVPKLLSRDNPDNRFLGCQVYLETH